jgi:hypothetical protein
MRFTVYVSILAACVLAKREAPKETIYVEYDTEWSYEPVKSSKEETYVAYDSSWNYKL